MLKTTPRSTGALAARRARAQAERERADAELRSLAAQEAARVAEAEAAGARWEADQEAARARWEERAAELAAICEPTETERREKERREPTFEEFCKERDRQDEALRRARAEIEKPLPHVARSRAEIEAELREIDDFLFLQERGGRGVHYNPETGRLVSGSSSE